MSHFDLAITHILENEGGFVNNPSDPGGATNFGISLRYLKEIGMYGDVNNDGIVDENDIKSMTVEEAKLIYKKFWWEKYGYDKIKSSSLAVKIFDFAINMGPTQAHKLLQRAINDLNRNKNLLVDGILGPQTILLCNIANEKNLENSLIVNACMFYMELATNQPRLKQFLKGWLTRAVKRTEMIYA